MMAGTLNFYRTREKNVRARVLVPSDDNTIKGDNKPDASSNNNATQHAVKLEMCIKRTGKPNGSSKPNTTYERKTLAT